MNRLLLLVSGVMAAAVLLVVLGACSVPEPPPTLDEEAQDIYRSLMCPLCPGQTIAESQSELSQQMRALVREKLEQGETKEEILRFFAERYGEAVLAAPAKSGLNLIVWLVPFAAIAVGGVVLWFVLFRKRSGRGRPPSSGPVSSSSDGADEEEYRRRLEKELREFGDRGFR